MVRPRRAWIYALTITALLVPAGGIAYLGAVSYRDERGAIAAQDERQKQAAKGIANRITREIDETLDAIERAAVLESQTEVQPVVSMPLGEHWFWIDASSRMRVPRTGGEPTNSAGLLDRSAPCAPGARLEECVKDLSTRQSRVARLHAAQRAETCKGDGCTASLVEARRHYDALDTFADTGPPALLGLARVHQRLGDAHAAQQALAELERRFANGSFDGVMPVSLVVALLRATTTAARLEVARDVLANKYTLSPTDRLGVLQRIRALVPAADGAALEEDIERIKIDARAAAGLAEDVPEILRTATPEWRVRTATREAARTLIYRRRADGGVIGMSVDAPMLKAVAGSDAAENVATHAQVLVLPAGATPPPALRTIVQVPLGEALPHLALAIVNPISDPDPRDAVIAERSKRHVLYTSALAIALGAGIVLIIRAAARQRELAQLKSDFVSTVSHELKTPLTSIRMFAEMLEQGVAQGDPAKMARYHGVIVQESQRLGLLIANLLDYAQIEKGTRRYAPSRHEVGQLARLAVTTFETLRDPEATSGIGRSRNSIDVEVSLEAAHAEVEVDRDVVVQAVLNLLANADKYGGDDQRIEVRVGADQSHAFIAVRDHGPGIPASEQPRIFREFYRSPEAYRSGVEGTGLGLALVKRHIEALGGTVDVASVVGQGATFTIRLPRTGMLGEAAV